VRNEQTTINVQAKNLDQALKNASKELGISPEEIDYEVISRTDAGLLSFLGGRKIEIKAWSKKKQRPSRRNESSRSAAPEEPKEPLSSKEVDSLVEDLRTFCKEICEHMTGETVSVAIDLDGERLTLNIENEFLANKIAKNTRLAESLEHILRKKPRYLKRELPFRIFVDAGGLRLDRESELVEMAKDLSMKVIENQKPIVLNYKSSYDRKIIHMALDKDDRVYTKSIGSGANRKLMILPSKAHADTAVSHEIDI
jgi:spoIIIJ-associated protein